MRYMMDGSESKIVSYHDLIESKELVNKSRPHINSLFEKYWTKYSTKVGMLIITNIYCNESKSYYLSIFDLTEVNVIEELTKKGKLIQIDYFCVYSKELYQSKREVLNKYQEVNFNILFTESTKKEAEKEKETKKIRQVFLGSKESRNGSGANKKEFFTKSQSNSITSFFKMGK